jgi:hypothetical protein
MSESAPAEATPVTQVAPEATPQQDTFSRDYVESLRAEAAKYRTEKGAAVDAAKAEVIKEYEAKAAEFGEKLTATETDLSSSQLELLKIKTVLGAGIDRSDILEVVALVQGSDEESVSESVNRVKTLLGKAPAKVVASDPSQGQGSADIPLNGNPVLDILKRAVGAS